MKWFAGFLAALGIGGTQPADVRQWEADTATAMAYAACLQEVAPTPAPTPKPDPGKPALGKPAPTPVACSECRGTGKIVYGPDHPVVKLGFKSGTYVCPMCGGSGKLDKVKPAVKPTAKPASTPAVQQSCPGGVCPAPNMYY